MKSKPGNMNLGNLVVNS